MHPTVSPRTRYGAGFAYDAAHHSVVLFGDSVTVASLGDTWHWNGTDWIEATPASSPRARDTDMAFDVATGRMVLFGGFDERTQAFFGDTWIL
jgi:hypothetical protein